MSYASHFKAKYVEGHIDLDEYGAALDRLLEMDPTALEEQGYDPCVDWMGRYQEATAHAAQLTEAQAKRRAMRQHVASDSAARGTH